MSSWADRLQTASWRGVEFLTDSHSHKGGRRLVIHEFPGRNTPVIEDMGAKTSEYRVSAYFIGNNYDIKRDTFLRLLNTTGAEYLMHPWLGRIWVRVRDWSVSESNERGGYCQIDIEFVPGGVDTPLVTDDLSDVAAKKVNDFSGAVVSEFGLVTMSAQSTTEFINQLQSHLDTLRNIIALGSLPLAIASQVIGLIQGLKSDIASLLALPSKYANALNSLTNAIWSNLTAAIDNADQNSPYHHSRNDLERSIPVRLNLRIAKLAQAGASQIYLLNSPLHVNLFRENMLRSSLLISCAANSALIPYSNKNERDKVFDTLIAAIDALIPIIPDSIFDQALSMRTAIVDAIRYADLRPKFVRDIPSPIPATVLAYRMEVDENHFLARNNVKHPLFVSGRVYG